MAENIGAAIGVFDSGVGGLTVVRALRRALPAEALVYLGDTARLPYGNKSPETVRRYSRLNVDFLLGRGVKLVLIACNTASAVALPAMADELSVPVLGAVEPGARAAARASRSRRVGVIGTLGTVRSGAYVRALHAIDASLAVVQHACPLLVPLAEEGWTDDPVTVTIAERYLTELHALDPDVDTLVLGCTHYPILKPALARAAERVFGRTLTLVDSADAMAAEAAAILGQRHALATGTGTLDCFVTDHARITELGPRFLGEDPGPVGVIDL